MLTNSRSILRPKVRFSESYNNLSNEKSTHYEEKAVLRENVPKIKSIEILKKPVRIIYAKQQVHNKDVPVNKTSILISTHLSDTASENIHNTSPASKNLANVNTSEILCNSNTRKNNKRLLFTKSSQDNVLKNYKKDFRQKGKENKDIVLKKTIPNKNKNKTRTDNSKHIQTVAQKLNTADVKSLKMTPSTSSIMKKDQATKTILNVKPVMYNVMPCYKKTIKDKTFPVKKTVLYNVSDLKIKTSVEPGISRKRQDNTSANERYTVAKGADVEKLAQPEYNSIMCTINKIKELEQQKIVTDIDHLPPAQKNLVIGKISMALDFPLDTAIYKNLVDLSVDEKQLPSTIMRSKDPEPRQKDITPKLSDFFTPEDTKEVCEVVQIKPRIPKRSESMSFSKISDKIFQVWKSDLDSIE